MVKNYAEVMEAIKTMFDTKEGELVRKYLEDNFLKRTCISQSPELTYYNLGQKEFVESFLDFDEVIDPNSE